MYNIYSQNNKFGENLIWINESNCVWSIINKLLIMNIKYNSAWLKVLS